MKRKILYSVIGIIAIILIVVGLFLMKKDDKTSNLTTIRVAEVTHSVFYTPFYVAMENGYFKDEGIDIDLMLVSGSDNVAASVLSNDTEVGLAGPESAIYVYLGEEKDYLQVFAGLTKRDGQFILARNGKEFTWDDLKGKEILIGRSTGMPGLSFLRALKNKNIDPKEININTSIEFGELSGAFLAGEGDFVNLFEPLATKLEQNNNGFVVSSVGAVSDPFPYTAFYARKSYINNNKELLVKFTRALNKGIEYTFNHESRDVAKVIANQFSDTDILDLEKMVERYRLADVWLNNPYVEEDFFNTLTSLLKENDLIQKNVYYKDLVHNLYE